MLDVAGLGLPCRLRKERPLGREPGGREADQRYELELCPARPGLVRAIWLGAAAGGLRLASEQLRGPPQRGASRQQMCPPALLGTARPPALARDSKDSWPFSKAGGGPAGAAEEQGPKLGGGPCCAEAASLKLPPPFPHGKGLEQGACLPFLLVTARLAQAGLRLFFSFPPLQSFARPTAKRLCSALRLPDGREGLIVVGVEKVRSTVSFLILENAESSKWGRKRFHS